MSSSYFKDRSTAGFELAQKLEKYRFENTVVIALSPGSVLVAEQIAARLHAVLMMLLIQNVNVSDRDPTVIGTMDTRGDFMFNNMYSAGEIEEWTSEFHGSIEENKMQKNTQMHKLLGEHGIVDDAMLHGRTIILVSSGLKTGLSVGAALNYLKPIKTEKIIAAVPVASINAIDRLHIITDEIQCLSVVENYLDTDHYYEDNHVPPTEEIVAKIDQIIKNWQ